jgi:ABC-type glycerol-3-phosphate transport system substrate-binding protein
MIEREGPCREVSGPAVPGRRAFLRTMGTGVGLAAVGVRPAAAQAKRLTVAYMPHPILLSQMEWMRNGAKQLGLELDTPAIAYVDYVQSMTAQFMSPRNRYQIIWNNDDWGQLFGPFLEPIDDVVKPTWAEDRAWMMRIRGKQTAAPFVLTAGVMFYRTDLVAENEIPKTFDELVEAAKKAQAKGVKWGIMGGSGFPHLWFTLLWSLWSNNADIFLPFGSRSWDQLEKGGWTPGVAEKEFVQTVEWWWDAIHTHKIAPPAIASGSSRTDTDAMFMQGDVAFAFQDSTLLQTYRSPEKSKVPDKVGFAGFPVGPNNKKGQMGWADGWSWSIPKNNPADVKKRGKELLSWLAANKDAQREVWKKVGGIPASVEVQKALITSDPEYRRLHGVTVGAPLMIHSAYYWPMWPEIHSLTSKAFTQALTGPREKIPDVLKALAQDLRVRAPVAQR